MLPLKTERRNLWHKLMQEKRKCMFMNIQNLMEQKVPTHYRSTPNTSDGKKKK